MVPMALLEPTAQGQITLSKYKAIHNLLDIHVHEGNYHLFGNPVLKSPSSLMH